MWQDILTQGTPLVIPTGTSGAILPHHMVDQNIIGRAWRALGLNKNHSIIVLVSPDHFMPDEGDIHVPRNVVFDSIWGMAPIAGRTVDQLIASGLAKPADQLFVTEHGIFAHIPYIVHEFPGVPVLPIVIRQSCPRSTLNLLLDALRTLLPPDALIVASVDFSHYNAVKTALFHDETADFVIENNDVDRIFDLEVDSPESLYLVSSLMRQRNQLCIRRFWHSQLQDHYQIPLADNTSHQYFSFSPGKNQIRRAFSLLLVPPPTGHMAPAPVPTGVVDYWHWTWRDPDATARDWPLLANLAGMGEEDRFFMGSSLYIFCPKVGSLEIRQVSGLQIGFLGLKGKSPAARAAEIDRSLALGLDFLAVFDSAGMPAQRQAEWVDWRARGVRLIVSTDPTSGGEWSLQGECLMVKGLGTLNQTTTPSAVLGLVWEAGLFRLYPFRLGWQDGLPVYADLPTNKSFRLPLAANPQKE